MPPLGKVAQSESHDGRVAKNNSLVFFVDRMKAHVFMPGMSGSTNSAIAKKIEDKHTMRTHRQVWNAYRKLYKSCKCHLDLLDKIEDENPTLDFDYSHTGDTPRMF